MSSERPAIDVQDLSKCYQIYGRPSERLKQFVAPRLQRVLRSPPKQYFREFWALRDVSFQVGRGESLGVIGRNGSGKSTLLQIICGTLSPTAGTVETNGRVAALLELGSGFNPEFSGRDNVYLNAALLGLTRDEVDHRFDRIAAFADVGEHLEQPVKTYSSGMFVRLAFAVLAHVDADILVVDEALAVGDAVFTQRCMRFIRSFQERGTLLFVSHDTASVQNLCRRALWLDHGKVQQIGKAKAVSEAYLQYSLQGLYGDSVNLAATAPGGGSAVSDRENAEPDRPDLDRSEPPAAPCRSSNPYGTQLQVNDNVARASGFGTGHAQLLSVSLEKLEGSDSALLRGGEKVRLRVIARATSVLERPIIGFIVRDRLGQDLFGENTLVATAARPCRAEAGQEVVGQFVFSLPMLPNGLYSVMASVADGDQFENVQHHYLHDALVLTVSSAEVRFGLVGIVFESVLLEVPGQ